MHFFFFMHWYCVSLLYKRFCFTENAVWRLKSPFTIGNKFSNSNFFPCRKVCEHLLTFRFCINASRSVFELFTTMLIWEILVQQRMTPVIFSIRKQSIRSKFKGSLSSSSHKQLRQMGMTTVRTFPKQKFRQEKKRTCDEKILFTSKHQPCNLVSAAMLFLLSDFVF